MLASDDARRPVALFAPASQLRANRPSCYEHGVGVMRGDRPIRLQRLSESQARPSLPSGTLTFMFTDIQASTRLWQQYRAEMREVMIRHDALIEALVVERDGTLVKPRGEGDSRFAVFPQASAAVASAAAIQMALAEEPWPLREPLRVRIALHTGEADLLDHDYYGPAVNRCARLRGLASGGQVLLSETTAALVRGELPARASLRDLGVHQLKDLAEPEQVFQLVHPDLSDDFPPLPLSTRQRDTLPEQPTPFILRTYELGTLIETLHRPEVRLLTLVGSGGIGKTRLAIALAKQMAPAFADGVWFIDLSAVRDAALVFLTVASACGVQNDGRRSPLDCLQDYLRERHVLLVLDNCEQVLDAAPDIGRLLSACTDVKILATSREPLRLRWEHVAPIMPLGLPHGGEPDARTLLQAPAIAFFVVRAQAADPAFRLTEDNRAAVAELCARLDGLPLALELAAARTRVLSPAALAERLDQQPNLLRGAPDAPLRQQSLRATVEWSHDLLTDDEQRLFRQLGVFSGGCTVEAANAVCYVDAHTDVLAGLASLTDKGLLRQERNADGDLRFRLLETMRHVALEMLDATQETELAQLRFTDHLLHLAQTVFQESWRGDAAIWVQRLSGERDNMRAALAWLIDSGRIEKACLLAAALEPLWVLRDHLTEGQHWLQAIVARTDDSIADGARTRALGVLALVTALLGDADSAAGWAQQSLVIARRTGDAEWLCLDLWAGGEIARGRADTVTALGAAREALELSRAQVMTMHEGLILGLLGRLTIDAGQIQEGRALLEQALTILERMDVPRALIHVRRMLGTVAFEMGDVTRGRELLEQAASGCRALGERWMLSGCLAYLGYGMAQQGDVRTARRLLSDSAELAQGSRDYLNSVRYLLGFARLAVAEGHSERAVRLTSAACGVVKVVPDRITTSIEKWLAPARSALGANAFAVWDSGQRLSVEQATAYALSAEVPGSSAGSLTSRELEVAGLVGRGLTNRQIGEALVIAPSTAERHLANIMNKLTMTTRTQVGVWASEHGYT